MADDTNSAPVDSWAMARLGNAIDAFTDRAIAGAPQMVGDPAQAYGVDQNGRIYTLGQVNGQIAATVNTNTGSPVAQNKMLPWLILAAVVLFAIEGGK